MGKLTSLFRSKSREPVDSPVEPEVERAVSAPSSEYWAPLDEGVLADAAVCHTANKDVGICTRGTGSASTYTVAGTPHRQDVLLDVAKRHGATYPFDDTMAAVVMREPNNAHDRNAIVVLLDGVHIGYLFREDAALWQPVLKECERREQVLVGSLRFYESRDAFLGASIALRDCLTDYIGPITQAARAPKPVLAEPRLLSGDELTTVLMALDHLIRQDSVRTKQKAGMVLKNFRKVLPQLTAHADALNAAADLGHPFADILEEAEAAADDMVQNAEDADEREDMHSDLKNALEELAVALRE